MSHCFPRYAAEQVRESNTFAKYLQKFLHTPVKFDEHVLKITTKMRRKIKIKSLSHFCIVNIHSWSFTVMYK